MRVLLKLPRARAAYELIARSGELASDVAHIDPAAGQTTRLTLTLEPAGITGVVVDPDGQPAASAQLWVNHDSHVSWGTGLGQRYFADERGGFAIDVPRGAYRISVRCSFDDDFLDQDDVVLTGGTRGARIVLP